MYSLSICTCHPYVLSILARHSCVSFICVHVILALHSCYFSLVIHTCARHPYVLVIHMRWFLSLVILACRSYVCSSFSLFIHSSLLLVIHICVLVILTLHSLFIHRYFRYFILSHSRSSFILDRE